MSTVHRFLLIFVVGTEQRTTPGWSLLPKYPFSPRAAAPRMGARRAGEGGCSSPCQQHGLWWVAAAQWARGEPCWSTACWYGAEQHHQHPSLPRDGNPMNIFGGACLQLSHLTRSQRLSLSAWGAAEGLGVWLWLSRAGMGQGHCWAPRMRTRGCLHHDASPLQGAFHHRPTAAPSSTRTLVLR